MTPGNRPLSPHLQVYKFNITMAASILQRITGSGLAVGLVVFAYWLGAAAHGPDQTAGRAAKSMGLRRSIERNWRCLGRSEPTAV